MYTAKSNSLFFSGRVEGYVSNGLAFLDRHIELHFAVEFMPGRERVRSRRKIANLEASVLVGDREWSMMNM